jgi:hypothetical protein
MESGKERIEWEQIRNPTGLLYGASGYYRGRYREWNQTLPDGDSRGEACIAGVESHRGFAICDLAIVTAHF